MRRPPTIAGLIGAAALCGLGLPIARAPEPGEGVRAKDREKEPGEAARADGESRAKERQKEPRPASQPDGESRQVRRARERAERKARSAALNRALLADRRRP